MKGRLHKSEFKAKVALTALRGEMTMAEMDKRFEVQVPKITQWKKQLRSAGPPLYAGKLGFTGYRHILARSQLMQRIYPDHRVVSDRTIDSHVKKLRAKLRAASGGIDHVQAVYGIGYRYEPAAQHSDSDSR